MRKTYDPNSGNTGWEGEERIRGYLYAFVGAGIVICALITLDHLGKLPAIFYEGKTTVGAIVLGALIGGWWATQISRDWREKGPPMSDEEIEKKIKQYEQEYDPERDDIR